MQGRRTLHHPAPGRALPRGATVRSPTRGGAVVPPPRHVFGQLAGLLTILTLGCTPPATAPSPSRPDPNATGMNSAALLDRALGPPPTVTLLADPDIATEEATQLCSFIQAQMSLPCTPSPNAPPTPAPPNSTAALDARQSVEKLRERRRRADTIVVRLTTRALHLRPDGRVLGYASLTDATAVVSLAGLDDDADSRAPALHHLLLHEIGHALGLSHHDDPACVLRTDRHRASLSDAPARFCPAEQRELQAAILGAQRAGWGASVQIRGHLARHAYAKARAEMRVAMAHPMHPTIAADLAWMFGHAGFGEDAISLWHQIPALAAKNPEALVQLAARDALSTDDENLRCVLLELLRAAQALQPEHRGVRRAQRRLTRRGVLVCPPPATSVGGPGGHGEESNNVANPR